MVSWGNLLPVVRDKLCRPCKLAPLSNGRIGPLNCRAVIQNCEQNI
jgi:hypothetical protein